MIEQTARQHPEIRFARYDSAFDESQTFFLTLLGITSPAMPLLLENSRELAINTPQFTYYVDNGHHHTILEFDRYYETRPFLEFSMSLVAGAVPEAIECDLCVRELP